VAPTEAAARRASVLKSCMLFLVLVYVLIVEILEDYEEAY